MFLIPAPHRTIAFMPLRLHNSLTRRIEPLIPIDPERVTFYSCGPTVYDDAHIGNFRSFLAADLLRRWIESPLCDLQTDAANPASIHRGPRRIVHVMNITDVGHMTDDAEGGDGGGGEDRMAVAGRRIAEAKKAGKLPAGVAAAIDPGDPYAIAEFYAGRFLEDALRLGLRVAAEARKDPTLMPRPTQKIAGMIEMIHTLIAKGHAYAVGPPGRQTVYFDVQSFPAYGRLSGNTLDKLRVGAGGRISGGNQSEKKHPADFLLWKADPAHIMKWPSPWGEGYPGWHLECSVMARERLGDEIDLHSGGEDNIFPHHECELAQTCSATGRDRFARLWFHPRFLFVEGEKMSKSKGNFFTARDLFAKGYEPAAVRLELIKTHYRSNANFTEQGLKDSQRIVGRWRRFAEERPSAASGGSSADRDIARTDFSAALHEDLNIAGAVAAINTFTSKPGPILPADLALLREFDAVLGVLELDRPARAQTPIGVFMDGLDPDPAIIARLEDRAAARKAKDFARSDTIRGELLARGYAIKDIAGGKVEVRRA